MGSFYNAILHNLNHILHWNIEVRVPEQSVNLLLLVLADKVCGGVVGGRGEGDPEVGADQLTANLEACGPAHVGLDTHCQTL